jgi:hypothetical protein
LTDLSETTSPAGARREQRVRADAYRAARLLDLGLTALATQWAEGHGLRQKAAEFRDAR